MLLLHSRSIFWEQKAAQFGGVTAWASLLVRGSRSLLLEDEEERPRTVAAISGIFKRNSSAWRRWDFMITIEDGGEQRVEQSGAFSLSLSLLVEVAAFWKSDRQQRASLPLSSLYYVANAHIQDSRVLTKISTARSGAYPMRGGNKRRFSNPLDFGRTAFC